MLQARLQCISPTTFYQWRAKFGGLELSEARRLRTLETENARMKRLLAEATLDNAVLKDVAKAMTPAARRSAVATMREGAWDQ